MRYLLLSVLVACMIGVMVPSAFAEVHIVDIFLGEQSDECPDGICISNKNLEVEPNDIVIFQYPTYPEMERMSWEGGTHANGPYDNPLPISNGMFVTLDGKEVRAFQFIDSAIPRTTTTNEYDDYLTEVDIRVNYGNEGEFNYFCMIHPWIAGSIKVNSFAENLNKIQNSQFDVNKKENGIFEFEVTGIGPSNAELTLELSVPEYEILSYVRDGINFTFKGTLVVTNPYHHTASICAPELTQALHGGDSTRMLCDSAPFHFGQEPKAKDWFPDIIFKGAITGGAGNGFYYYYGESIDIAGTIENAVPNVPLSVVIYDPMRKIVVNEEVEIDSDGKFLTSIIASGDAFSTSGEYTVFFYHSYMRDPGPAEFTVDTSTRVTEPAAELEPELEQSTSAEEPCYAGPLGNIDKYGMDPNTPICPPDIQIDDRVTEIRTDQGTYQYGETVNFTVEIFGEGFGDGYHDLKFMISEQGNQTVEDVRIRVGEQKTFQFEPENYTWTQEYQVSSAGQLGLGTGWNTKTSFNVLPAGGCGEGTVLVDGACQLAPTQSKTTSMSIDPLYLIIGAVGIGGVIAGVIAVAKRGSGTPKPRRQELDEYEEQYLEKEKPKRKPAEKKETSSSCSNCGKKLKPTAKFCGGCGTKV